LEHPVRYAGFWQRVLSHLIDSLLLGMVQLAVLLPFMGVFGLGLIGTDLEYHPEMLLIILAGCFAGMTFAFVTGWLYYALMESSAQQANVGKIVVRLKVTDLKGARVTFARSTGRYFSRILSGLFFGIGFLMAAFTQQKQTLHDIIAGTLVVER
jgi:uncharacterized RDD family membrane protein YckC